MNSMKVFKIFHIPVEKPSSKIAKDIHSEILLLVPPIIPQKLFAKCRLGFFFKFLQYFFYLFLQGLLQGIPQDFF